MITTGQICSVNILFSLIPSLKSTFDIDVRLEVGTTRRLNYLECGGSTPL
jgi:hypothetical protein